MYTKKIVGRKETYNCTCRHKVWYVDSFIVVLSKEIHNDN